MRLIVRLLEICAPWLVLELVTAFILDSKMFPISRAIIRRVLRPLKAWRAHPSLKPSTDRLRLAQERLKAADADRRAVLLEHEAERIEDEANRLRTGDKIE